MSTAAKLQNSDNTITFNPPILVVLVFYQRGEVFRSLSLPSFLKALDESGLARLFGILIYDNSPFKTELPYSFPLPFHFIHDPENGGLFRAYTAAQHLAQNSGYEWLLLLDQDTVIDAKFIRTLWSNLIKAAKNPRCAALVPKLLSKCRTISPVRVLWGGFLAPVEASLVGFARYEIMALNSGTLLRVSAIRALGGFNPTFWLDYLDHWLFNQLHRAGYLIFVLDSALQHELSVRKMDSMSVARYKNILVAEREFYRSCKSRSENLGYYFKLLIRVSKMCVMPDRYKLLLPTLNHIASQMRKRKKAFDNTNRML